MPKYYMSYNFSNLEKGLCNINAKLLLFLFQLYKLLKHIINKSEFKYKLTR